MLESQGDINASWRQPQVHQSQEPGQHGYVHDFSDSVLEQVRPGNVFQHEASGPQRQAGAMASMTIAGHDYPPVTAAWNVHQLDDQTSALDQTFGNEYQGNQRIPPRGVPSNVFSLSPGSSGFPSQHDAPSLDVTRFQMQQKSLAPEQAVH